MIVESADLHQPDVVRLETGSDRYLHFVLVRVCCAPYPTRMR